MFTPPGGAEQFPGGEYSGLGSVATSPRVWRAALSIPGIAAHLHPPLGAVLGSGGLSASRSDDDGTGSGDDGGGGSPVNISAPRAFYTMEGIAGAGETDTVAGLTLTSNFTVGSGAGARNLARTFNGSTQYLSGAHSSIYQITANWSIAFWFKPVALATAQPIVSKTNSISFPPFAYDWLAEQRADNTVRFGVADSASSGALLTYAASSDTISASDWNLVVAWYDWAASTIYIQVNNGTVASASFGLTPHLTSGQMWVGKQHIGSAAYFSGSVDALAFWDVILTTDERSLLWNSRSAREFIANAWTA